MRPLRTMILAGLGAMLAAGAQAQSVTFGFGPSYIAPPPPVYYAPPPPPVYYVPPRPVYVPPPPPVYYAPPRYYGPRYYPPPRHRGPPPGHWRNRHW
ncbi:hypothetical protein [Sabulicella glaciei]|uniref:Virulence factor n=1 Tax=Sabulicella glaciei TaxID=2984948 RepID=A0ABT3NSS3_9PROT|nr:hypothetical protein [Roseococcus sp. MDT2-1-1]MCW8085201.1 hypothetical protein [Roseococcus sp. MDT2-1-1]